MKEKIGSLSPMDMPRRWCGLRCRPLRYLMNTEGPQRRHRAMASPHALARRVRPSRRRGQVYLALSRSTGAPNVSSGRRSHENARRHLIGSSTIGLGRSIWQAPGARLPYVTLEEQQWSFFARCIRT